MKKIHKKAQAWGFDLIISAFIFVIAIALFYNYSINLQTENEDIDALLQEGISATNILLSEGYPINWGKFSVEKPGLYKSNNIDRDKLQSLLELASENYSRSKNLLGTKYDYYFFFSSDKTEFVNLTNEGIGKTGITSQNINSLETKKLVKITRMAILDKKPVKMSFYLWSAN